MITILCLFLAFISPFFISPIVNDITLHSFSKQLFQIELPDTKIIQKYSRCGKWVGNGNGMDYLACVIVETDLTYEELETQLKNKSFEYAKFGATLQYGGYKDGTYPISIDIAKVDSNEFEHSYLGYSPLILETPHNNDDYSKYYALLIVDGGYSAGFDIRGH